MTSMNPKLRNSLALLAISASMTLSPAFSSADEGEDGEGMHSVMRERAFKKLDLSAEQREKIRAIRKESRSEMKDERTSLKELRIQMKEKMAGNASEEEIRKLFGEIQTRHSEFRKKAFDRMLKIRAVLTPEQRKELAKLLEEKRGGFGKKHRKGDKDFE